MSSLRVLGLLFVLIGAVLLANGLIEKNWLRVTAGALFITSGVLRLMRARRTPPPSP